MVSINEELTVAKAAKAAIKALLAATSKTAVLATLRKANHAAILNLSGGGTLKTFALLGWSYGQHQRRVDSLT